MATQVTTSLPMWLAGATYDANGGNDLRNSAVTATYYDPGIISGSTIGVRGGVIGGAGLAVTPGTGMTVSVQPGSFVVPNSGTPTAGGYASTLASSATLTVQTADPSNSRIDIVVAVVVDNGNSTSSGMVQIITGAAAPTPTAPTAPANSITLAKLTVPAAASSITSAMIADQRPFTTTTGGVLVAGKGTATGYDGQLAYDKASGTFYHNTTTSGASQLKVLPWQPVMQKLGSPPTISDTNEHTIMSQTITTDGFTDLEIFFKCPGITSLANSPGTLIRCWWRMYIDGTMIDTFYGAEANADTWLQAGVSWSYYTSPSSGDTPSAGTHTVSVTCQNTRSSVSFYVGVAAPQVSILRVKPVSM